MYKSVSFLSLEERSDEELMAYFKNGDSKAFECLYNRYWKKLFIMAFRKVRSEETAKELLQQVFVDFWFKRDKIEIRKSVYNYLYTSLKYSILDFIRASSVRKKYALEILKYNQDVDNSTLEKISLNDLNSAIEYQINQLPEKCQQIFNMSRKENYSIKEIAERLNISTKTVENQLHKALKNLRSGLKDSIYFAILSMYEIFR